jgi:hypothetical protein
MSSVAETRRLRSGPDEDAERLDDLDDADRGVDAASWLAASDVGHAKCCLALLRVSDGIDGMSWSDRGTRAVLCEEQKIRDQNIFLYS